MNDLVSSIKKHEGLRLKPYKCSAGKLTIGYGRNLDDIGISRSEANDLLLEDIKRAQDAASQFNWWRNLDGKRQDVVVEMIFNLGLPRFLQFKKAIQALRDQDYDEAADQMLDSKWAKQVGKRAVTLADKMRFD